MILATEKEQTAAIKSLGDWMDAFDRNLESMLGQGIVGLKSTTAYLRSLLFRNVSFSEARAAFAAALHGWKARGRKPGDDFSLPPEVQDFMMHHILRAANEKHLVFQFHTGLQEGSGNTISNSDPSLMSNLFLAYPEVDFDLFHISYPYQGVAAALAKNFRNVFVDMCWAHIISPAASRAALSDFLDVLPFTKISAFGGDYAFVDGICGHLSIARENVAQTLAEKVSDGVFRRARAAEIGRALFHDNPLRIFRLRMELGL
jgi:predicted TIM-barrel fold metal-dependent hydrolase